MTEVLYVFLGLSLITLGTGIARLTLKKQNKSEVTSFSQMSLIDLLWVAGKYTRINKRYVFASLIGLIVATTVISQILILTASYNNDSFDEFLTTADTTGLEFTIDGVGSKDIYLT